MTTVCMGLLEESATWPKARGSALGRRKMLAAASAGVDLEIAMG
jgi:hypothetical protein